MVKINKVYTRQGDKGETSLVGGRRLRKDSLRIDAYGTVDELNAIIGMVRTARSHTQSVPRWETFEAVLQAIQQKLFDLGSELATHEEDSYEGQIVMTQESVQWLERIIDSINTKLDPLESFVLPGASRLNATLHLARTVCRRAERNVIRLNRDTELNPWIVAFLNRLSDTLFVFSRWACAAEGESELLWSPQSSLPEWE